MNRRVKHVKILGWPRDGVRALVMGQGGRGYASGQLGSGKREVLPMCRNIKNLFNFDPPVTDEEIRDASLQFVRKISGFNKPSKANEASFLAAIDEVARASARLLRSLETNAPPKNRVEESEKLRARAAERFGD
jgi:hypothetical protein